MKTKQKFRIPAGTIVRTRNVFFELKLRSYVTQRELQFEQLLNTGDGGYIYLFRHDDWLIAVEAEKVIAISQNPQPSHDVQNEFTKLRHSA